MRASTNKCQLLVPGYFEKMYKKQDEVLLFEMHVPDLLSVYFIRIFRR